MPNTGERRFKRGQIICKPGEMDMNMYNILYGSVAVYKDYGTPEEVEVVTLSEGDFFNVISFLESRPRNTTVVALEPLVVSEITIENFGKYFSERPHPAAPEGLCGDVPRAGGLQRQGAASGGARRVVRPAQQDGTLYRGHVPLYAGQDRKRRRKVN